MLPNDYHAALRGVRVRIKSHRNICAYVRMENAPHKCEELGELRSAERALQTLCDLQRAKVVE